VRQNPVTAYTIYGIRNCDTMKKAQTWLAEHGIGVTFHDYKREGVTAEHLERWIAAKGWEAVLNRAGTTFRKLPEADRADIDAPKAAALMLANPSMIKRPVLEGNGHLILGFRPELYSALTGG